MARVFTLNVALFFSRRTILFQQVSLEETLPPPPPQVRAAGFEPFV